MKQEDWDDTYCPAILGALLALIVSSSIILTVWAVLTTGVLGV